MQDLISRQAAIDAITEYGGSDIVYMSVGELKRRLEQLPSAQPEKRWIPVTERLPEKYIGKWMCCMDDGTIEILPYDTPGDGSKECVFYYWEDDYTVVKPNVVAWMPLPESYAERRADEIN